MVKVPYCIFHNYVVYGDKLHSKCGIDRPFTKGISYKKERPKGKGRKHRCKYLVFLEREVKGNGEKN